MLSTLRTKQELLEQRAWDEIQGCVTEISIAECIQVFDGFRILDHNLFFNQDRDEYHIRLTLPRGYRCMIVLPDQPITYYIGHATVRRQPHDDDNAECWDFWLIPNYKRTKNFNDHELEHALNRLIELHGLLDPDS